MRKIIIFLLLISVILFYENLLFADWKLIFNENFNDTTLTNWKQINKLSNSTAFWTVKKESYDGSNCLYGETKDCWPCDPDISVLINKNFKFSSDKKYKIEVYIKNTSGGHGGWNRPNTLIYSVSDDGKSYILPQVEHSVYLSMGKCLNNDCKAIIDRKKLLNLDSNVWIKYIIEYDPANSKSVFSVYDINNKKLASVESNETPFIGDRIGFRVYRGWGYFDNLKIYEWNEENCNDRYNEGYNAGYEAGKKFCQQNPSACGISVSQNCNQQSSPTIINNNTNNCSTFDFISNTLHIPCFNAGTKTYWFDFSLTGSNPITLQLKKFGENK